MKFINCRICYKVILSVFISILIVEAIILLPSVKNYERDELIRLSFNATNTVKSALNYFPEDKEERKKWQNKILKISPIKGFIIYNDKMQFLLKAGETPISPKNIFFNKLYWFEDLRLEDGTRFDLKSDISINNSNYSVFIRINTDDLDGKLISFIFRIIGLVALITSFVTITTMLILNKVILQPILLLRRFLINASEDTLHTDEYLIAEKRNDEIGDLYINFNNLVCKIGISLKEIIQKEHELEILNSNLEKKVSERTKELREEIQERKNYEKKLIVLSNYDIETDLPNLNLMRTNIQKFITNKKGKFYIIILTLNDFQEIRNSFGFAIAIEYLKKIAQKIKPHLPVGSLISRIGPPKLGIICDASNIIVNINDLLETCIEKIVEPMTIQKKNILSTVNMGLSLYPNDADNTDNLLSYAEIALSESASYPNSYRFHNVESNRNVVFKRDLLSELHMALKKDEFFLVYQPKVNLKTGLVESCEALERVLELYLHNFP